MSLIFIQVMQSWCVCEELTLQAFEFGAMRVHYDHQRYAWMDANSTSDVCAALCAHQSVTAKFCCEAATQAFLLHDKPHL